MDSGVIYNVSHSQAVQQQLRPHLLQQQQPILQPLEKQQPIPQTLHQQQVQVNSRTLQLQQIIPEHRPGQLIAPLYQQLEPSFPREQQSQINLSWKQPFITLETESQLEFLFPVEKSEKDDCIAELLRFNPEIVPPAPPANIMQDDKETKNPPSEFDDMDDDNSLTFIREYIIPKIMRVLDLDFYCLFSPEDSHNIGTLHAVIPESNSQPAMGPFSIFRIKGNYNLDNDKNDLTMVNRNGHFNWSRATKTWEYANLAAVNTIKTDNIQNIEKPYDSWIFQKGSDFSLPNQNKSQLYTDLVPGAFSTIFRQNNAPFGGAQAQTGGSLAYNIGCAESELKPKIYNHLNTDSFNPFISHYFLNDDSLNGTQVQTSGVLAWDDPLYEFINVEKKPKNEKKEDSPGPFSSLMSQISSFNEQNCSDLFGKSSNPSVLTLPGYLSSIQTKNIEEALPSSSQRARGSRGGRISRRGGRYAKRTSADLSLRIISKSTYLVENMAESTNDQNQTRLRRKHDCIGDDAEKSIPKRRKKATIVTTPGPTTRSQSKKQSSKY